MTDSHPAADVARERRGKSTLSDTFEVLGVTIRMVQVPTSAITDAISRIKPPEVPMWHNPDKDRMEPNHNDPGYLARVDAFNQERGRVSNDVMILFGTEIVAGFPPEDDSWLRRIRRSAQMGVLDLSWVDLDDPDPVDLELLFLKYVAVTRERLAQISQFAGLSQEAIAQAQATFPGDEGRGTD